MGTSETVKEVINKKVSADAKVLKLHCTGFNSVNHVSKEGNYEVGSN